MSLSPELIQTAIEEDFECLRCGNCCKGDGLVTIGRRELRAMAAEMRLTPEEFVEEYAIRTGPGRWILRDKWVDTGHPGAPRREQWCILLDREPDGRYRCRVNEGKPDQCRSFPARWRNQDSLRSCAGLRAMMRRLRESVADDSDALTANEP